MAAGVPSWATDPFVKASMGDLAGAVKSEKAAITMFMSPG